MLKLLIWLACVASVVALALPSDERQIDEATRTAIANADKNLEVAKREHSRKMSLAKADADQAIADLRKKHDATIAANKAKVKEVADKNAKANQDAGRLWQTGVADMSSKSKAEEAAQVKKIDEDMNTKHSDLQNKFNIALETIRKKPSDCKDEVQHLFSGDRKVRTCHNTVDKEIRQAEADQAKDEQKIKDDAAKAKTDLRRETETKLAVDQRKFQEDQRKEELSRATALKKVEAEVSRSEADAKIAFDQQLYTLQQKQASDEDAAERELKEAQRVHSKAKDDANNNAVNARINLHAAGNGITGQLAVSAKDAINSATSFDDLRNTNKLVSLRAASYIPPTQQTADNSYMTPKEAEQAAIARATASQALRNAEYATINNSTDTSSAYAAVQSTYAATKESKPAPKLDPKTGDWSQAVAAALHVLHPESGNTNVNLLMPLPQVQRTAVITPPPKAVLPSIDSHFNPGAMQEAATE